MGNGGSLYMVGIKTVNLFLGGERMEIKTYLLMDIKELKLLDNIEEANQLLKANWLLVQLTANNGKEKILLGRVN